MLLLFDIGNTHTHVGLAAGRRILRRADIPSSSWTSEGGSRVLRRFVGRSKMEGAVLCSVVPQATPLVAEVVFRRWKLRPMELTSANALGIGIDYPRPETIGPDRLANAIAARALYGSPAIVLDFGTAVTFDVIDRRGNYVGGVITPGLAAMTDYLHEKTALLPPIRIHDIRRSIGRSTEEAMCIGAVHGYRGLIRELIGELKRSLGVRRVPVVATGGYARLIARRLPEITAVRPALTLEGLVRFWVARHAEDRASLCRLSGTEPVRTLQPA